MIVTPIEQFYESLGPKEQKWLLEEFPDAMALWVAQYTHPTKSDWLTARTYQTTDALAVALVHLKEIYPFRAPRRLYRLTGLTSLPSKPQVKLGKGTIARRPLLSWTDLPEPQIHYRTSQPSDIILTWSPVDQNLVIASYKVLPKIFKDLLDLGSRLGNRVTTHWARHVLSELRMYEEEREYMVYLFRPITCTWRPAK